MPKLAQLYQLYQELSDNLPKKSQKLRKLIIAINPSLQTIVHDQSIASRIATKIYFKQGQINQSIVNYIN